MTDIDRAAGRVNGAAAAPDSDRAAIAALVIAHPIALQLPPAAIDILWCIAHGRPCRDAPMVLGLACRMVDAAELAVSAQVAG